MKWYSITYVYVQIYIYMHVILCIYIYTYMRILYITRIPPTQSARRHNIAFSSNHESGILRVYKNIYILSMPPFFIAPQNLNCQTKSNGITQLHEKEAAKLNRFSSLSMSPCATQFPNMLRARQSLFKRSFVHGHKTIQFSCAYFHVMQIG